MKQSLERIPMNNKSDFSEYFREVEAHCVSTFSLFSWYVAIFFYDLVSPVQVGAYQTNIHNTPMYPIVIILIIFDALDISLYRYLKYTVMPNYIRKLDTRDIKDLIFFFFLFLLPFYWGVEELGEDKEWISIIALGLYTISLFLYSIHLKKHYQIVGDESAVS